MLPYIDIGPVRFHTFPLIWMILFMVSWSLLRRQLRKTGIGGENYAWLIATAFVAGVSGAKIYGLIKYWILFPNAPLPLRKVAMVRTGSFSLDFVERLW